jgi:hypothetical protein
MLQHSRIRVFKKDKDLIDENANSTDFFGTRSHFDFRNALETKK